MSGTATVPGYTITGVAGISGDGAVRRGTDTAGRPVAIRFVPEAPAGLVARAHAAAAVTHPGIAPVLEVAEPAGGGLAVVQEFVDGPALSTLRAARRGLSTAECTQLAVQLLAALEVLHAAGIVHGDVSPANVIVTPTEEGAGHPVLVDLIGGAEPDRGTRGFRAPEVDTGVAPGTAADVYSAARLSLWVAEPGAREEVGALLAPLLAQGPAERPSAHRAQQMLDGGAQVAIQLAPAEVLASATLREHAARELTTRARSRRPRPRRRHRARGRRGVRRVAVAVAALAVLAGGVAWWRTPGAEPEAAGPDSAESADARQESAEPQSEDMPDSAAVAAAVRDLLAGRDEALRARDAVALAEVTVPGSPLAASDAALLIELTDADLRLQGFHTEVLDLSVLSAGGDEARVRAELQQAAHSRIGTDGAVEQVPAQPVQCVQLQVERPPEALTWRAATATAC